MGAGGIGTGGTGMAGYGGGYNPEPGLCGNGAVEWLENCDDANADDGDGCSALCQVEPGYVCTRDWDTNETDCEAVSCGDGRQDYYPLPDGGWFWEACDDGNTSDADGCSATCSIEHGWVCNQPGTACHEPTCGDGVTDFWTSPAPDGTGGTSGTGGVPGTAGFGGGGSGDIYHYEACDDGNTQSGDGCDASCERESGWLCDVPGTPCREPRCGDGYIDFIPGQGSGGSQGYAGFGGGGPGGTYEGCDDANTAPGDGCDASCQTESGWACWYVGENACHPIVCGDGLTDYPEETCDDANDAAGDGCYECNREGGGWGGTSGTGGWSVGGFGGFGGWTSGGPGYGGSGGY